MERKKLTSEQLAVLVDIVAYRHDFDMLGWSDSNGWFVAYFDKQNLITSELIVELQKTLGLTFLIDNDDKYFEIKIRL